MMRKIDFFFKGTYMVFSYMENIFTDRNKVNKN